MAQGLAFAVSGDTLSISTDEDPVGLGAGDRPPPFELPGLTTGELIRSKDFLGKPVVFYMRASW